ncbi:response regulator [Leptolyngbya sp. FACHB-321]|uniref:hybrid sensor histidine kinase/response regulator n=1 Tax=Leptolyngbya sp. FACHB-321 TaxID=2692807 RepID=UPI001687B28F|nr:response regulator [Leptolyngbya sp. FACHB-321]MBD2036433.1 response regulator [Leptolyngbya sp. FACHB-321]
MRKVLVIEDEQDVREIILDILEEETFYAIGAENGRVGVQLAQEMSPELIICDVMMPELDGYGVLTELRQNPATAAIPLIFLTAKVGQDDFREGMGLGADDYLSKPFTRSDLLKAVTTRMQKQATLDQKLQQKLSELRSSITLALPQELTGPLNAITASSRLLMDASALMEQDEIVEIAENIHQSSQSLYRLVQNFLLYAQLELAEKEAPERAKSARTKQIYSARAVITELALQKMQRADREADLELELEDAAVQISEIRLKKIVEELLDNAIKFSQPGTLIRIVSLVKDETFALHIVDNGRGMTTEQIASMGAYMQFERKLSDQQGFGLGLVIVKRLVELQGGVFVLESIPGQQTVVRLVLPLAQVA